jgi:hypothetical protein
MNWRAGNVTLWRSRTSRSPKDQPRVIIGAAKQVARAIFFSLTIIIVSFVPVFRFEFEPDGEVLTSIIRMIDAERQCCRFLRFQLTVEPAGSPAVLEVTGPPGSQQFLEAMIERA